MTCSRGGNGSACHYFEGRDGDTILTTTANAQGREFIWPVRVYYEDTDSGGVVYYANYLRFLERARTEWLRSYGVEQHKLKENEGIIFAVRSIQLDFLKPAILDDLLDVTVTIARSGGASITLDQGIHRNQGENELLCSGQVKVACLDASTLRPHPIPKKISREIISGS